MRFIGDTHAKFDAYRELANEVPASIQVGDFGVGFKPVPEMDPAHRFIRGNHDDPEACKLLPNWIEDGAFIDGIFFMGGATSIDKHSRVEGVEYWPGEEMPIKAQMEMIDRYEAIVQSGEDIKAIVSHEVPENIARIIFADRLERLNEGSRTRQALEALHTIYSPPLWIFGHWHKSVDTVIDGTRFICLNELEYIDLDMNQQKERAAK